MEFDKSSGAPTCPKPNGSTEKWAQRWYLRSNYYSRDRLSLKLIRILKTQSGGTVGAPVVTDAYEIARNEMLPLECRISIEGGSEQLVGFAIACAEWGKKEDFEAKFRKGDASCWVYDTGGDAGVGAKIVGDGLYYPKSTPAMSAKTVGEGSIYLAAFVDSKGKPFEGGNNYKLHLSNVPVNYELHVCEDGLGDKTEQASRKNLPKCDDAPGEDLWSLTLYDNQTNSMLQTNQQWPAIHRRTKGLRVNPDDGSLDIYFGPEAPTGKESNWIQTIPGRGWKAILRLRGPREPWFEKMADKRWRPGRFEQLDQRF